VRREKKTRKARIWLPTFKIIEKEKIDIGCQMPGQPTERTMAVVQQGFNRAMWLGKIGMRQA
jgi:hypothetical protein